MTTVPSASVDQICEALKQSPLFQLSLASKELFHSNFLAWLCDTYPDHAGRLFAAFLSHTPPTCEDLSVHRERLNTDVWLSYPDGEQLVIENKVKSLATIRQLEQLTQKGQKRCEASFLLLSLMRPPFLPPHETTIRLSNDTAWQYLTYRELADRLFRVHQEIEAIDGYHGQLLHDYIGFITQLDALQTRFTISWDSEQEDFFIAQDDTKYLKRIRMHDMADKMRYGQLEQRVADVLRSDGFSVAHEKLHDVRDRKAGQLLVSTDMTRGVGLFNLQYIVMNKDRLGAPVILGVQVQGHHFRLVVETENKSKVREIATALWRRGGTGSLWFDFGQLPNTSQEYPKERAFNQYSGMFFYRSKWLDRISPKRLVDAIAAYARSIHRNEEAIRRRVEAAL